MSTQVGIQPVAAEVASDARTNWLFMPPFQEFKLRSLFVPSVPSYSLLLLSYLPSFHVPKGANGKVRK
jgi:hypothetical protein